MQRISQNAKAVRERKQRYKRARAARFNEPLHEFVKLKYPSVYIEYEKLYERLIAAGSRKWKLMNTKTFKQWKATVSTAQEANITTTTNEELIPIVEEAVITATNEEKISFVEEPLIEVQEESTNLQSRLYVPQIMLEPCVLPSSGKGSTGNVESCKETSHELKGSRDSTSGFLHPNNIINTLLQEEGIQEYLKEYDEVVPVKEGDIRGNDELTVEPTFHPSELYEDPDATFEFQQVNNIINELIYEHEIQEYIQECDEGIDIDPLAELTLDIEPFDFDLEVEGLLNYEY